MVKEEAIQDDTDSHANEGNNEFLEDPEVSLNKAAEEPISITEDIPEYEYDTESDYELEYEIVSSN